MTWLFLGDQLKRPSFLPHVALFQRQAQIPVIHQNGTCCLPLQKSVNILFCYVGTSWTEKRLQYTYAVDIMGTQECNIVFCTIKNVACRLLK